MIVGTDDLGALLEDLYRRYGTSRLPSDPLRFPRAYSDPLDREVVALVAATLAYGNAKAILTNVARALEPLGPSPVRTLLSASPAVLQESCREFRHRWTSGRDLAGLLWRVAQALREYGSLRTLFLAGYEPGDVNVGGSLTHFVDRLLAYDATPLGPPSAASPGKGIRYLLTRPADGSACKRLNMVLRWVVRRDDGLDLGLWPEVSPRQLVIPLDTHSARVARGLGLTRRATTDWRTAEEVTAALRRYDPVDPVRYDFALCHVSMSGDWKVDGAGKRRLGYRV